MTNIWRSLSSPLSIQESENGNDKEADELLKKAEKICPSFNVHASKEWKRCAKLIEFQRALERMYIRKAEYLIKQLFALSYDDPEKKIEAEFLNALLMARSERPIAV